MTFRALLFISLYLFFQVFPLDYILITVIIMYFIFTSMAGIRNIGIWFFWVRVSIYYSFVFFIVCIISIIANYQYRSCKYLILKLREIFFTSCQLYKSAFCLEQWFLNSGDFAPQVHLAMSRGIFSCYNWGCSWHLLSGGQGFCSTLLAQGSLPQDVVSPKCQQSQG